MPLAEYLSWATAKVSASAIISSEGLTEGETASKHTGQDSVVSAHLTPTPPPPAVGKMPPLTRGHLVLSTEQFMTLWLAVFRVSERPKVEEEGSRLSVT